MANNTNQRGHGNQENPFSKEPTESTAEARPLKNSQPEGLKEMWDDARSTITSTRKKLSTSSGKIHGSLPKIIIARWQQLIDGLDYSANEFYSKLEKNFARRQIPNLKLGRVAFNQRGPMSDQRIYLRLIRNEFIFDICASPMGKGAFYVSYWHGFLRFEGPQGIIERIALLTPILGYLLEKTLAPDTFHYTDDMEMFQQLAHSVVVETVNDIANEASLPQLSEDEQKPVLRNLLNIK